MNFLNIALGSPHVITGRKDNRRIEKQHITRGELGESVSGLHASWKAKQITEEEFQKLDTLAYKLENGLLKLVESLELKREKGEWIDSMIVKESVEDIPLGQ